MRWIRGPARSSGSSAARLRPVWYRPATPPAASIGAQRCLAIVCFFRPTMPTCSHWIAARAGRSGTSRWPTITSSTLRWYFQFTPHDLDDWDANQPPVLIDTEFHGRPRKALAMGSRNGFFYVLDRLTGELLLAQPFVKNLTWASGIGADGRPKLLPGSDPTVEGTKACPSVEGATNWMSTAYNPATGLFYVMSLERCNLYYKSSAWWEPGKSFYGGTTRRVPGEAGEKILRAIDIQTGKIVWEYPQMGPANSWGGVLSTAG